MFRSDWFGKGVPSEQHSREALGIDDTYTRDMSWLIERFGVGAPYAEGAKLLHDSLRVRISTTTIRKRTTNAAMELQGASPEVAPDRVDFATLPESERLVITSLDGTTVRTTEQDETTGKRAYRELAAGRVYTPGRDAVDAHTVSLTTAHEAGRDIRALTDQAGGLPPVSDFVIRPTLIGIADGGLGYQNILQKYLPIDALILDLWHLLEHVREYAEKRFPDDPTQCDRLVRTFRVHALRRGGQAAKAWLEADPPPAGHASESLYETLMKYLNSNKQSTDYHLYRRKKWPLGSGPIEAACKTMIGQRLKGAGMSWNADNAAAVANLRAIHLDGRRPCPTNQILNPAA